MAQGWPPAWPNTLDYTPYRETRPSASLLFATECDRLCVYWTRFAQSPENALALFAKLTPPRISPNSPHMSIRRILPKSLLEWLVHLSILFLLVFIDSIPAAVGPMNQPWPRHTIDAGSRGADGVRLMDVNVDGLMDVVTGWEEGGEIRVCLQPESSKINQPWPVVSVGNVKSPEDAVFADLDGDGAIDVISSCEGGERTIFIHWAPKDLADYTNSDAWETTAIPATLKKQQWMFCLPMDIDGQHGMDLVVGSKNKGSIIGWLQSPADPRKVEDWKLHKLYDAGWIMSIDAEDLDGDGDLDVIASDRRGKTPGVLWLENPEKKQALSQWNIHRVGGKQSETMFLDVADLDGDGLKDILAAVAKQGTHFHRRLPPTKSDPSVKFETHVIPWPVDMQKAKSVRVGDIDLDGRMDMVITSEPLPQRAEKVFWLSYNKSPTDKDWTPHRISGPAGEKFDLTELIDLDNDGDLDVLTCEERDNLGVIWYENPTK